MKKSFYFALALTAGLFASCSSDEIAQAPQSGLEIDENAPALIELGVTSDVSVTRGTGTAGADPATGAVGYGWAGQLFNVYMLNKGALSTATQIYGTPYDATTNPYVYDNAIFKAPEQNGTAVATAGMAKLETGVEAYYPTSGVYDFWAYRLDDAKKGDPLLVKKTELTTAVAATDADYIVAPFEIDGSQDIMVAETAAGGNTGASGYTPADVFSAKTARRAIRPNFTFNHMLTRLSFKVKAASKEVSDAADDLPGAGAHANYFKGFKVTAVTVKSKSTGNVIVAYIPDATTPANDPTLDQRIAWDDAAAWPATPAGNTLPEMFLKSRAKKITTPATGSFQTLAKTNFEDPAYSALGLPSSTRLYTKASAPTVAEDCDIATGRPKSTLEYKTLKAWKDLYDADATQVPATLYKWTETIPAVEANEYSASQELQELVPVVPIWAKNAYVVSSQYTIPAAPTTVADATALTGAAEALAATGTYYYWVTDDKQIVKVECTAAAAGGNPAEYTQTTEFTANAAYTGDLSTTAFDLADATAVTAAADALAATGDTYYYQMDTREFIKVSVSAVGATDTPTATPVGEALLVAPADANGYTVTVYYSHYKPVNSTTCELDEAGVVTKQIQLKDGGAVGDATAAFKRNAKYNITIVLYKDGTGDAETTIVDYEDDTNPIAGGGGTNNDEVDFE